MDTYQIRHNTLAILSDKALHVMYGTQVNKDRLMVDANEMEIEVAVLLEKLNVTEFEFRKANNEIVYYKEASYILSQNGTEAMQIENEGLHAYENRKYLKERFQERNENIYAVTKWVLPLLAIILSIAAIIISLLKNNPGKGN